MKLTNILVVLLLMLSTFTFSACNKNESSDISDNPISKTSTWEEEIITSNIFSLDSETYEDDNDTNKGKTKAEFLFTEDGLNLQIVANKAAIAYLRNDKEELSQYLVDSNYDALSDNAENIFNQLQYIALKLPNPTTTIESDNVYSIVYQILIHGNEMIIYLDLGLKKTDNDWKVEYIYLQG